MKALQSNDYVVSDGQKIWKIYSFYRIPDKATGVDEISTSLLKYDTEEISEILFILFNRVLGF